MKRGTEEKKKRWIRKAKKLRSMVMMVLMSILLLSAATYAWFTLGNQARVSNLTMTVSEVTGLTIALPVNGAAPTAESAWSGKIELKESVGRLLPATSADGKKFSKPVYNEDGEVSAVKDTVAEDKLDETTTNENKDGYYYETTFYLRSVGQKAKVMLAKGENLTSETKKGTYLIVNSRDEKSGAINGAAALRVSFTAGDKTAVYEPYADVNESGTKADVKGYTPSIVTNTEKQSSTGTFTGTDGNSNELFTLERDKPTLVTLRIWVEGNDEQCVNEMQLQKMLGQIQFISEKVE